MLNHTVGCFNINFSCLFQLRREKICFASNVSIFLLYFFCVAAVVSMPRLANFSLCDPVIFCFSLTLYTHNSLKNEFFSNVHGYLLRKEQRKRKVQATSVSNRRGKKLFFALFWALTQTFFAVIARHRWEAIKKKRAYWWLKNKEPGERNVTFWSLILMFIFHEKCQTLGHVKMQNLPCNTPLFLVFLPHSEPL